MAIARKGLLEILQEKQLITAEQKEQAEVSLRATPGKDPVQYLIDNNLATDVDAYRAKAEAEGMNFVDLTKYKPEPSALNVVPQNIVDRYKALPVRKDGPKLWVAMSNPRDINAIDDIRRASRCTQIIPLVATPADLETEIKKAYGSSAPPATGNGAGALATAGGGGA